MMAPAKWVIPTDVSVNVPPPRTVTNAPVNDPFSQTVESDVAIGLKFTVMPLAISMGLLTSCSPEFSSIVHPGSSQSSSIDVTVALIATNLPLRVARIEVGTGVGRIVGCGLGIPVGGGLGKLDGRFVGEADGGVVGVPVGVAVGSDVGLADGAVLGEGDGLGESGIFSIVLQYPGFGRGK